MGAFWRLFAAIFPNTLPGHFYLNLGSFLSAFSAHVGTFFAPFFEYVFLHQFGCISGGGPPSQEVAGGKGGETCGSAGALHFGVRMVILPCVYAHSAQAPVKRPRDSHLSDLSQVTLQVPLGSCTGNFKKGRHWQKASPHAGDGAKVTSSRGGFMGYALCRRPLTFLGRLLGSSNNIIT